jgi:ABC-type cobalamin/Fe3+-siderophores transport system ATPase subunit
MSDHPLEVTDLVFAYDGRRVLEGVSLHLMPGEVLGLIGPNGAGKSTLVKLVAGLLCPYGGSVKLFGRPPADWRQRDLARTLAVVPQSAYLPPTFTVWESALLGRTPYLGFLGMARERDRRVTHQALEWVGIAHRFPAASGSGWCWPGPWLRSLVACFWMSLPLTWTCTTRWLFSPWSADWPRRKALPC